ncbi:porin [Caballeronia novacaledonica]|uniref:porin n=1 Tax=Caballeronia novacaledonica TaxID=1544861 RepID=UPI000D11E320|nr:porin [Caballeronia novacaledonica]
MAAHILAVLSVGCTGTAYAQSSVTLFGMIDSGISYVSNRAGHSAWQTDDGINGPNLWGFIGKEDIGGGTKVIFNLVNQFSLNSGAFLPGQSLFTRNAFVGLSNDRFGTFTLGNQYDFMVDALYNSKDDPAIYTSHLYGQGAGPFQKLALPNNPTGDFDWYRAAGRLPNSVKYVTPNVGDLSAGAMYGFGGVAGSVGTGNSSSFAVDYARGNFGFDAAYTFVKYPTTAGVIGPQVSVRNWGVGTRYQMGPVLMSALFVTVKNNGNGASVYQFSTGANWLVRPDIGLSASYAYMKGNEVVTNNHAHQFGLTADYYLSKRTTVYAMTVYQRANEGANALIMGLTGPTASSDGPNQLIARVGLRTRF